MLKYDFEEQSQSRLPSFYSFSPLHLPPLSIHTYTKIDSDDSSCHVSRHSRYSISSPIFFFFFFSSSSSVFILFIGSRIRYHVVSDASLMGTF